MPWATASLQLVGNQEIPGVEAENNRQEIPLLGAGGLSLGGGGWVHETHRKPLLGVSLNSMGVSATSHLPNALLATAVGKNLKQQMEKPGGRTRSPFALQCLSSALC